ncbi:uncharacterized protein CLUP02_03258 [Colletotrichum lupini]|uniref:Uncharacterized protein n=1 Tax=Colletotrichum lupini TaxID=145971 RepID=A0A9Q8SI10_9PEZI|nr:uncharacterized protein CLUP02_03258 [Colletotrichum lupini]UQC77787.1 hypothetical protein CLUP02_03258 [Colletotrichum lupini]
MEQDDQELTRALGQAAGRMDHGDLEESDTPGAGTPGPSLLPTLLLFSLLSFCSTLLIPAYSLPVTTPYRVPLSSPQDAIDWLIYTYFRTQYSRAGRGRGGSSHRKGYTYYRIMDAPASSSSLTCPLSQECGGDIGWWCGGGSLDFQATSEPRPSVFQHLINTELIGQQHLTVAAVLLLFSSCFYASTFLPSPPPGEAPLSVRSDDKMQSGIRRLGRVAMVEVLLGYLVLFAEWQCGEDRTGRDRAGAVIHAAGKTPVQGQREREKERRKTVGILIVFNLKRGVGCGERGRRLTSVHSRLFDIEGQVSPEWVPALFSSLPSTLPIRAHIQTDGEGMTGLTGALWPMMLINHPTHHEMDTLNDLLIAESERNNYRGPMA